MPKFLVARVPTEDIEERQVRKLAASRHAPGDWILRARMIARSWDGLRTTAIAAELGCHPQTVRERIARFTIEGLGGLRAPQARVASPGSRRLSAAPSSPWPDQRRRAS